MPTASRGAKAKKKRAPQTLSEAIAYDLESEDMWTKAKLMIMLKRHLQIYASPLRLGGPCEKVGENMNFM